MTFKDINGLKAFIAGREFELAKELFGLTDGKHRTEHHQPCILSDCDSDNDAFRFNSTEGTFHCRRCGFGGDIIDLAREVLGLSFTEAFDRIADIAGYTDTDTATNQERPSQERKPASPPAPFLPTFRLDTDSPIYKATAAHRPDITFDDYQRAGAKLFKDGIAIPMFDTDGIESGWVRYFQGGGKPKLLGKSGIVGVDAIYNLRIAKQVKIVFKTAGVSDYLVLSGVIERLGLEADYYAFTNGAGEGELPGKFEALMRLALTGLSVIVIQDNDEAGESGALRWAESFAEYVGEVYIKKLPDVVFDCPIKDLRDFLSIDGTTFADLYYGLF